MHLDKTTLLILIKYQDRGVGGGIHHVWMLFHIFANCFFLQSLIDDDNLVFYIPFNII